MQLNEVSRKAGIEKGREKGKKRGAGKTLLFPFPFLNFPPPLPLPFFAPATPAISKMARPRGQSTGTPTSLYDCRNYNHSIGDVSQA